MKVNCAHTEMVDIDTLVPNPKNPNKHGEKQIKMLAKIMNHQGWRHPVTVSTRSGFVIAGHGRLVAARLNGWESVPVDKQDFENEADEYAHMIADNKIAELAEHDDTMMHNDLKELPEFDYELLGIPDFEPVEVEVLEPQSDEDEVPGEAVDPRTGLGDIWQLGKHRLMCGSCTSQDDMSTLMGNNKADITFTSPPYNVGKTPNGNDKKYINDTDNRNTQDFKQLLNDFTSLGLTYSDYIFSNIQSLSGNKVALIEHLYDMREVYSDTIIWDKKTAEPAMARRVLNSRFEYIHVFSLEAKRTIGKKDFRGTLENVFELNSRQGKEYSKVHKATFPVQLPEHFILNFTESSVLDTFGGTGTTLIACEKTNRTCYMMELEPKYVRVIIERWEKYTGRKAELINGAAE